MLNCIDSRAEIRDLSEQVVAARAICHRDRKLLRSREVSVSAM